MNSENSPYKVSPHQGEGLKEINLPTSKSYANRLLVLAAISPGETRIQRISDSSDVETMLKCFEKIGLTISRKGGDVVVSGSFPECESLTEGDHIQVFTGDGGTTNRFIMPLLSRGKKNYELIPTGHMRNRPMKVLADALSKLEVRVKEPEGESWYSVRGPIREDRSVEVDCEDSTQFLTGLALSCADKKVEIRPVNLEASLLYWKISQKLISDFKKKSLSFEVPFDFSSASYPLALGATLQSVLLKNCTQVDHLQADANFISHLKQMGASIEESKEGLIIQPPKNLKAIVVDGSHFPDLVPTLAYVCSYADGESQLNNLKILRHKESDRVEETLRILDAFKVKYEIDSDDNLRVFGNSGAVEEVEFRPPEDHRMVMVAFLFMIKNKGGRLFNAKHVAKSFPQFFSEME